MQIGDYVRPQPLDRVLGDNSGLMIPAHPDALAAAGPAFLTAAFRSFGAMAAGNEVKRIVALTPFIGGNSGDKAAFSVEYARPEAGLPTELFVKFSRAFSDGFLDRRRYELEPEVRLAGLSRHPAFPIRVPIALFADFHAQSGTGLLITERVAFGKDGVEPHIPKCQDFELADPLGYYRSVFTTLASLAGAQKSGILSPQAEKLFPFDIQAAKAADPIRWTEAGLRHQISLYAAFVESYPRLMPPHLRTPEFIARLERESVAVLRHHEDIRDFLHEDGDYIALCHWNGHLDNGWFWRDETGTLCCGLMDWGRVRQMSLVYALWGCVSAAETDLWDNHLDALLALFVEQFQAHGGPAIDLEKLKLQFDLYVAIIGLSHVMDSPAVVLSRLPAAAQATGLQDPVFRTEETARAFLHSFTIFMHAWFSRRIGDRLTVMLASRVSPVPVEG